MPDCRECGEKLVPDPDGSPGVLVHDRDLGDEAFELDREHGAQPEDEDEGPFGDGRLRAALAHVKEHGFGDNVDADAIIEQAAAGLLALYDDLELGSPEIGGHSAGDQCSSLYEVLGSVGLDVP